MALKAVHVSNIPINNHNNDDECNDNVIMEQLPWIPPPATDHDNNLSTFIFSTDSSSLSKEKNQKKRFVVGGHRGSGMNSMQSSDRRMKAIKENTILSFNTAACSQSNLDFVEFDVQVTRDDCPVIFHDCFLYTQDPQGTIVEKRVTELSLDEFLSYGPQRDPSKTGKPLFRKTKDGRVFEWRVEKDDQFCTLEDVFTKVADPSIGFDIELKFDDNIRYKKEELEHIIRVILNIVDNYSKDGSGASKNNKLRPVFFSSFNPDAVHLLREIQATYPVFFLTKGGADIHADPRRNSLEEALKLCKSCGLQGVVSESKAIFKNPGMVTKIKDSNLSLLTYGQLNNVPEAVYMQYLMGVDGAVVDFVPEIIQAAVSTFTPIEMEEEEEEEEEEMTTVKEMEMKRKKNGEWTDKAPRFSERELSFLFSLMPELVQQTS